MAADHDRSLLARADAAVFEGDHLHVVRPITLARGVIGTISVQSDISEISAREQRFIAIVAGTVFGACWIALLLSHARARRSVGPIARLVVVTGLVGECGGSGGAAAQNRFETVLVTGNVAQTTDRGLAN